MYINVNAIIVINIIINKLIRPFYNIDIIFV